MNLTVKYDGNEVLQRFFIIELGGDSMLLGMPFLAAHNPNIDWSKGQLEGEVSAHTADAHLWTPHRQHHHLHFLTVESWDKERATIAPNIGKEETNLPNHWPLPADICSRRVTRATKLAIDAANKAATKEETPWYLQVPLEYHRYKKVFSEDEAKQFPASRPWDHAIELLPNALDTLDCKVYPLAPAEQDALNEFIKDHLDKGYIHRSNSPYASPFFFIRKKDEKRRPVQDYRQLNEWTVRNRYPLPLIKELIARLANKNWFTKFDVRWGYNNVCYALCLILVSYAHLYLYSALSVLTGPFIRVTGLSQT
jgi:hypothetical protein